MAISNETGLHTGRYFLIRKLWAETGYSVWNGNNNTRLTNQLFPTDQAARKWAEQNGFTPRPK